MTRTLIGFNDEERRKKQDLVLNVEIVYQLGLPVLSTTTWKKH